MGVSTGLCQYFYGGKRADLDEAILKAMGSPAGALT
jgi:hypothetical protein